ncbi:flagellar basal-body MS-ring/collar protein FliF [Arenibaculum pallidiluteum]|uniref:flagellar basal-body MS-ring/collar protein FliF n=1 Tax=Arenibaculum pallidiluteum TaxID=2812559 RepID=UPI001A974A75|nr:flagellar basal-body MS-ring/collar protein FliF [Arenibaculum pallidiluteum]
MSSLLDTLRTLGRMRLMALGGVGLGIVVAVGAMAVLLSRPAMMTLYSGLDPAEAGRLVKAIEETGVPVSLAHEGSAVMVPQTDVARVRMALAEKGLPSRRGTGYELFDSDKPLGITSFMQKVNRLRALEGELGRTIETLSGVDAARVHLVLPDREAFSRDAPVPTASVLVRMRGNGALERRQALAIRHLVSAAVPSLKPSSVTVMDSAGEVLLTEEDGGGIAAARNEGLRASTEQRLNRAIEQVLAARLGHGNVRVQVAAELETKREVLRSTTFDPASQVVRSTQTVDSRERNTDAAGQTPTTVEQNLPQRDVRAQPQPAQSSSETTRQEETVNYEVSNVQRETMIEPGDIRRLTVAVLVNGRTSTTEDGSRVYEPRSPEELAKLAELVRSAIGFSEARGDKVTVENLEFTDPTVALPERGVSEAVMDTLSRNVMTLIQWVVLMIVMAMVILMGLRPLIQRIAPPAAIPDEGAAEGAAMAAGEQPALQLAPPQPGAPAAALAAPRDGDAVPELPPQELGETMDQLIELRAVEGRVRASSIRRLGDIVDQYPDEAINILRSWLYEEAA